MAQAMTCVTSLVVVRKAVCATTQAVFCFSPLHNTLLQAKSKTTDPQFESFTRHLNSGEPTRTK